MSAIASRLFERTLNLRPRALGDISPINLTRGDSASINILWVD